MDNLYKSLFIICLMEVNTVSPKEDEKKISEICGFLRESFKQGRFSPIAFFRYECDCSWGVGIFDKRYPTPKLIVRIPFDFEEDFMDIYKMVFIGLENSKVFHRKNKIKMNYKST